MDSKTNQASCALTDPAPINRSRLGIHSGMLPYSRAAYSAGLLLSIPRKKLGKLYDDCLPSNLDPMDLKTNQASPVLTDRAPINKSRLGISSNACLDAMKSSSPPRKKLMKDINVEVASDDPAIADLSWVLKHPSALKKIEVVVDFDHIRRPIVDDPDRALMYDDMLLAVRNFAKYLPIAIISGRSRDKLDKMNKKETTEKYKRVRFLGSGSFGEVWLVVNNVTKEQFAMKCIERGPKLDKYMAREIIIHKSLCHPNVIQFMEVVLSLSYLGIVMEYANGGNLYKKIPERGLDEDMARYYFLQLISGVSYLHSKEICHRDLKPENILLDGSDSPCLKICDFGFSKSYQLHSKPKSAVGTVPYSAPEVCSREYDGKLADSWSCGGILYEMLVGEVKYPNDTGETSNVYETNAFSFPLPDSLSSDSKELLARMLVADPGKRITIEDVKKHQWFKKKLKRELPEATQVTKENPRLSLQSDEEIEKIVKEAKIRLPEDAIGME